MRSLSSLLVAGLAVVGGASLASAQTNNAAQNDINVLNYALALEHLEADFYRVGLAQFDDAAFARENYNGIRPYLELVRAHETAHVNTLSSVIGSGAVNACAKYNWTDTPFASVQQFLATSIILEETGVSAYAGALNAISNTPTGLAYQTVAAQIATIEARHASVVKQFSRGAGDAAQANPLALGADQQATGTDKPLSPADVLTAAGAYIVQCNAADLPSVNRTTLPIIRPNGVNGVGVTTPSAARATSQNASGPANYTQAQFDTDNVVLATALGLEQFAAAFYNYFVPETSPVFDTAAFTALFGATKGAEVQARVKLIRDHENAHASFLSTVLTSRNQVAAPGGCYNFSSITTLAQFLAQARTNENLDTMAYDGAANLITATDIQQAAATIVTVEAKHAAYLNGLLDPLPALSAAGNNVNNTANTFPSGSVANQVTGGAFDQTRTVPQILAIVNGTGLAPLLARSSANAACPAGSTTSGGSSNNPGPTPGPGPNGDGGAAAGLVPTAVTFVLAAVAALLL